MSNPLLSDRDVAFQLYEVHGAEALTKLPAFAEHSKETFELFLSAVRRFSREVLAPTYRPIDEAPPTLESGRVRTHALMKSIYPQLAELGLLNAARPAEVGGQQLPTTVFGVATAYLMAANLSAYGYAGLTTGAAHLIETFGTPELKRRFMEPMYAGRFTGTMALTEPQAGSSLADVKTRATDAGDGSFRLSGSKIFISGGDNDFAQNVVHLVLARIDGAPSGTKGISLFAVPRLRDDGADNDVSVAGVIHKIGWKGIPSLALNFGERGDCRGWLVGAPHRGLPQMFQMMNEARIMVGMNAVASAAVAFHESVRYAQERPQGRAATERDPSTPQVPIVQHADVRRMLLRQKAIVEGGLSLLIETSRFHDLSEHAPDAETKERAKLLLDLLTPVAKTFPAEKGFEANALAVQIHGGYGYSSEYPVEAWLRDQKLNTIHEGTSGIQSLDLLGRKVVAGAGAALRAFVEEIDASIAAAHRAGVHDAWGRQLREVVEQLEAVTAELGTAGLEGDVERMLRHSAHYLDAFSTICVAWQWLKHATAAKRHEGAFAEGKQRAAQYWFATELSRVPALLALIRSGDDSYARLQPEQL
ncbi:MAG: acyl-CoA dehydrogenase [Myxococcota bacterium]